MSVPRIHIYRSTDINAEILTLNSPRLGVVKQHFGGPIDANAMLLFAEESAIELVHDMMGSQVGIEDMREFEQDALCELGNIILNACMSSMADVLSLSLESSLPTYAIGTADMIVFQIVSEANQDNMLVLYINLAIKNHNMGGHLVFLLNSSSLEQLIDHVDSFTSNINPA
jgi:chemotaxis protein CheC